MSEYEVAKSTIARWYKKLHEKCHKQTQDNPEITTELDMIEENLRLRKELEELRKKNLFLKKWHHSLRRKATIGLSIY